MERKIKIEVELTDKGLYPMPKSVSFIVGLIDTVFMNEPVCVDRISVTWVYED